ncbi:histidine triad (HIT) family protein [Kribbella voronezhensis]|uniref:Histidine triad (HIT) family protein n=1 Tax=Kribbella voronezhensis TaxID=2512212 RepID=A0A4R7SVE4_9ACTN|nr:HIT family protein [Kribbella voronezhensis]TDU82298.1 histidine triad (HIT) family protein [Kribbella voronezhensis]
MSESCIFCAITAGRASARFVYEDDDACAFLDINPLRTGHTLVVPRRHVRDLTDEGAAETIASIGPALQNTARLLSTRLDADGISVLQANGAAAGQTVFHLHFHLLPRPTGDSQLTDWTADSKARETLDETHHRLRAGTG